MSAFYTALFMTLIDLSSPFEGYWSIKKEAVSDAAEALYQYRPSNFEQTHEGHSFIELHRLAT